MSTQAHAALLADVMLQMEARRTSLALVEAVEASRSTTPQEHVTVETVFTESANPLALIHESSAGRLVDIRGGVSVLWLSDDEGEWFLACFPAGPPGVFHLVATVHTTHRRWRQVNRWIGGAREIMRAFLDHGQFHSIGSHLSEFGDVEVARVTARSLIDGSSYVRGWKAAGRAGRPTHADALEQLEYDHFTARTLTLQVGGSLSLHLRRLAGATFYSGDFSVFSEVVLGALARASGERRSLISGRERRPAEPVRPISIQLTGALFESREALADVIDEISGLSHTSLAVFHRNPYLHLAMTDEIDGSNFDLVVAEATSIDVYPGYRATPEALARLTVALGDRFGAQKVVDRAVRQYSLNDLMGQ